MNRLTLLIVCVATVAANAATVCPGQLPRGEYADTEATTNVPFAFGPQGARNFRFELSLAGTPSNNVQLAFGRDDDSDGVLSAEETDMSFAWDCGGWRIANFETGDVFASEPATTNYVKSLSWDLLLRRGRPRRLAVSENGEALFPGLALGPWMYSPEWDTLRITVRGVDAPEENVRVGMEISGLRIRMR